MLLPPIVQNAINLFFSLQIIGWITFSIYMNFEIKKQLRDRSSTHDD